MEKKKKVEDKKKEKFNLKKESSDNKMIKFLVERLNEKGLSKADIDDLWNSYLVNKKIGKGEDCLGKISIENISGGVRKEKLNLNAPQLYEQITQERLKKLEEKEIDLEQLEKKIELLKLFVDCVFNDRFPSMKKESFWTKFSK